MATQAGGNFGPDGLEMSAPGTSGTVRQVRGESGRAVIQVFGDSGESQVQIPFTASNFQTSLQELSDLTIHSDTSHFVHREELEEAGEILDDQRSVVLTGPPGSGKTALGHALLRKFAAKGFTPYVITHVHDILVCVRESEKSVILLDGTLGEVRVDRQEHKQWRASLCSLLQLCKSGTCLLVITAYPHIMRELRVLDAGTDSPLRLPEVEIEVRLPRDPLGDDIKREMLAVHLQEVSLDDASKETLMTDILKIDISGAAFPWCCRQMVKNWKASSDPKTIFAAPAEAYVTMLQRMLIDPDHGRALTAVLALTMKGHSHFLHKPLKCQPLLTDLGLGGLCDFDLAEYAHFLKGSVLSVNGDAFFSRVLYDAAGLALGRQFMLSVLLKVCDIMFFVTYVQTWEMGTEFTINIGPDPEDRQLLMQRIVKEIMEGNLPEICQHPVWTHRKFLPKFERFCIEEDCWRMVLKSTDTVHQQTLTYWSGLSNTFYPIFWWQEKTGTKIDDFLYAVLLNFMTHDHQDKGTARVWSKSFQFRHALPFPRADQCMAKDVQLNFNKLRSTSAGTGHRTHTWSSFAFYIVHSMEERKDGAILVHCGTRLSTRPLIE